MVFLTRRVYNKVALVQSHLAAMLRARMSFLAGRSLLLDGGAPSQAVRLLPHRRLRHVQRRQADPLRQGEDAGETCASLVYIPLNHSSVARWPRPMPVLGSYIFD